MSELQSDEGTIETNEPVIEDQNTGADLATASDEQHEPIAQVDEEAEKQKAIQDVINKKTFETKQAQRDLQSANDKVQAFEDAELRRKEALVADIPAVPDPYDDNFDSKMADRDAALLAQADFNSTKAATLRQQELQQQQVQQQQQEQVQKSAAAYDARSTELGISPDELRAAGTAVLQYGLSNELTMHILSDKDGPLITKHLAANPQEGFELASMSPYAVGTYLDGVRAKAGQLKPKTSSAPAPADTLQGNGAGEQKHPALDGVIYS